jgi:hypothetical protein
VLDFLISSSREVGLGKALPVEHLACRSFHGGHLAIWTSTASAAPVALAARRRLRSGTRQAHGADLRLLPFGQRPDRDRQPWRCASPLRSAGAFVLWCDPASASARLEIPATNSPPRLPMCSRRTPSDPPSDARCREIRTLRYAAGDLCCAWLTDAPNAAPDARARRQALAGEAERRGRGAGPASRRPAATGAAGFRRPRDGVSRCSDAAPGNL